MEAFLDVVRKHQLRGKLVAVVSDTPNVMKVGALRVTATPGLQHLPACLDCLQAMWELLQAEIPGLLAIPCLCHVLNLLCKVGSCSLPGGSSSTSALYATWSLRLLCITDS
jgi:hypothetical protein